MSLIGKPKDKDIKYSDREQEVLRSAARLFNKNGYHNTTMDDIAANLKVTKPALYYYAKSKDEMLFKIVSIAVVQAETLQQSLMEGSENGRDRLRAFFLGWTEVICDDYGRCLVMTRRTSLETETRNKNRAARRKVHDRIADILKLGMQDGSIKDCEPELMALALFDLFNGVTNWYKPKGKFTAKQIADIYWETFVQGLLPN